GTRDLKQWEARRKRGVELYKKGWNQYQIAEVLGVTQPSVSKWVRAEAAGGDDSYVVDTDYMAQSRRYMPGEASEEQYRYYAKDRQGSVSMMTAHNDGTQIQELYHYDAWGEHLPGTTPPAVENKIRYVGARVENFRSGTTDAIYHMGERHYRPAMHRFLQRDRLTYQKLPSPSRPFSANP
ncbi:MAG TPA: helix-turn-helix domain-containing protein, partial [bacterium]